MPDINPILRAAESSSQAIQQATSDIQAQRNTQAELASTAADAQTAIGLNAALISEIQGNAAISTQNAKLKAGSIFGANLAEQGEAITDTARTWNDAYQRQLAAAQRIEEKDKVSLFSDPLQYIINQFTINEDIREHNAALSIKNIAKAHIDEINAMADTSAKVQANFTQSVTQASVKAGADNALKAAAIAASEAKIKSAGYNVEGLQAAINSTKDDLNIKFNVQQAQNAQASLQLAMDNYALHKEEFNWRKVQDQLHNELALRGATIQQKEFEWKTADRATQEMADDILVEKIQKGLITMYGDKAPNLEMNPKLAKNYLMLLKSNSPAGKEALNAYMLEQSGTFGSPAAVVDLIKSGVAVNFTPAQEPIKKVMESSISELNSAIAAGKVTKPGNAAESQALLNTAIKTKLEEFAKNISSSDAANPYNVGAISTIASMPGVSESALGQYLLGPALTAGAKFDDPKQVFAATVSMVQKKEMTVEQAASDITFLYRKAVDTNLATKEFTKFGIVPAQTYKTTIQTNSGAFFGGSEIVDMTDYNEVKRALMKSLVAREVGLRALSGGR